MAYQVHSPHTVSDICTLTKNEPAAKRRKKTALSHWSTSSGLPSLLKNRRALQNSSACGGLRSASSRLFPSIFEKLSKVMMGRKNKKMMVSEANK